MIKDDRQRYDPRRDFFERDRTAQEAERVDEGGTIGAIKEMTARNKEGGRGQGPTGLTSEIAAQLEQSAAAGGQQFADDDLDWS